MYSKAERTSRHIIASTAPIFNRNGYAATSMSTITSATGLTKGAIYGNFRNKEELAVKAFRYNVKRILRKVREHQESSSSPLQKLLLITDFYRNYYDFSRDIGGCPIINIGVDANHQNKKLLEGVRDIIRKIERSLADIIAEGRALGELKPDTDPVKNARQMFSIIEGAVFMSFTMDDLSYLESTMDILERMILEEWKNK
ncbi:TetR/AcrR family transcriptional regulator [Sinomicrobium weinanense]|uniref:TetR/AcrR family transcriptional regulator n=1 Tax=Sinomicrobium weinanense TaxID=2842200 RepID=A0A926Q263_9FLAO|nr:TetR/AcrR family transcriptional regulator [Sinomicrobium weinanense]MBC9796327.1 TetR/AcrR family transcriptional regulator [Sinomicrobium weinanense]MBU3122471.1 TetR/AcrR family transcriptional regulator [Sinomicrobium weinanense]